MIPDSTALAPAVRSTVIVTVPPAGTLIGKVAQAPLLKSLDSVSALDAAALKLEPASPYLSCFAVFLHGDRAGALERLGKMKLTLADRSTAGTPVAAKLLVSHPNYSGLQIDQLSRNYIPADFMQTLEVSYNGSSVFRLESDISISEDPGFNFSFRPADATVPGVLRAETLDSNQRSFTQSWPVPAAPQM